MPDSKQHVMKSSLFSVPEKVNKIPRQQTVKCVTGNVRLKFIENRAVIAPIKYKHLFFTEKLHACRNIARNMFPENYESRMSAYSTIIKSVQKHRGCDVVEAATAVKVSVVGAETVDGGVNL